MQRAESIPARDSGIGGVRCGAGTIRIERDHGVDGTVEPVHPCERCLEQLCGRKPLPRPQQQPSVWSWRRRSRQRPSARPPGATVPCSAGNLVRRPRPPPGWVAARKSFAPPVPGHDRMPVRNIMKFIIAAHCSLPGSVWRRSQPRLQPLSLSGATGQSARFQTGSVGTATSGMLSALSLPPPVPFFAPPAQRVRTLVGVDTWFWVTAASWRPVVRVVLVGKVVVTVVATPVTLQLVPGDGSPPVSCPGPGTPWLWPGTRSLCSHTFQRTSTARPLGRFSVPRCRRSGRSGGHRAPGCPALLVRSRFPRRSRCGSSRPKPCWSVDQGPRESALGSARNTDATAFPQGTLTTRRLPCSTSASWICRIIGANWPGQCWPTSVPM